MEATRTTVLCVCCVLFALTDVTCELIHIRSLVHHGIEGRHLLLSVDSRFPVNQAEIQGTWSHTKQNGARTTLVTFTKENNIMDMMYRNHLLFRQPNVSLLILKLKKEDEGYYHLSLNIEFHNKTGLVIKEERTIYVTVDEPVSIPVIEKKPSYAVIEDKANVTWTCSVEKGTRVVFQWFRDNVALSPSKRYHFLQDNSTLFISPVRKEDKGTYRCTATNPVSPIKKSRGAELNVYYGPYNLEVNSVQGLRTGEVFTINPGELVFFECQADSNPPNSYVWISKSRNATQIITEGPRLEVRSYKLAQTEEYLCRAFNNVTKKQDEAQFTLVVASLGTGKEKYTDEGRSVSPLAVIAVCSSFIIGFMLLFLFRRTCHPKRVLMNFYNRPFTEQKRPHRSGHEDATEDFGIYEFVSIPGKMESTQASCRSLARLESVQDMHTTIYDVIRHVPESPSTGLLK
ncbi:PREDICTED: HEPACAM family member 2 [Cyprinodon variegatus]|uniref:HEPACAM family member 2 n=1 Tax=Cyprinodon variegatus TaxID=28743 RepID=A0A3Q2D1V0_CYPVA|nr:PREDICTED: HEPACAM family member 2 [Cyprinodon variegatus]